MGTPFGTAGAICTCRPGSWGIAPRRVFFEVWRSRDRFDPDRSLEAWVFAIARRRAIDHLRRPRHVTVPIELVRDLAGGDGRDTADSLV